MRIRYSISAVALVVCILLFLGCENDIDRVKSSNPAHDGGLSYGQAFQVAFSQGTWTLIKAGKKDRIVQFAGKISPELHDYTVLKLNASGEKLVFGFAINYLASLIKQGKAGTDSAITFDLTDYPINRSGMIIYDFLDGFTDLKDNRGKMERLNTFYRNRYFQSGTDVLFQWRVYAHGKIIKPVKASNLHWDNDLMFSDRPDNIVKTVFEYALHKNVKP